jgi:alanine-glyoxylate transaminase/serine-glyoxylate transaminase/serine-pyruvate transaminase
MMEKFNFYSTGRHFMPVPLPDRVLHAIDHVQMDHYGPEFSDFTAQLLEKLRRVMRTSGDVVILPSSSTGAREAAMVNTMSPGDRVLVVDTGYFSALWKSAAESLGLQVDTVSGDWRQGADTGRIEAHLAGDTARAIHAVCVVHSEMSTGITSQIADVRAALDRLSHPALLLVDVTGSLGAADYRHDEWGVDVSIGGSQKGLMLPPGLGFNAVSRRALEAGAQARLPRSYWDWAPMLAANRRGGWPGTPPVHLLCGLSESLAMLLEEGLEQVIERHRRHAEATRRAAAAWGLEVFCQDSEAFCNSVTVVYMPVHGDGSRSDPESFRRLVEERFELSLAPGLGPLADSTLRIGHVGGLNDMTVIGALAAIEMGLKAADLPYQPGGAQMALDLLANLSSSRAS